MIQSPANEPDHAGQPTCNDQAERHRLKCRPHFAAIDFRGASPLFDDPSFEEWAKSQPRQQPERSEQPADWPSRIVVTHRIDDRLPQLPIGNPAQCRRGLGNLFGSKGLPRSNPQDKFVDVVGVFRCQVEQATLEVVDFD